MSAEIIHGDCLDVLRGMPDASVDAIVTDPPYGTAALGGGYGRAHQHIANDADLSALEWALPEIVRVCRADAYFAVFCGAKKRPAVDALLAANGLAHVGEMVWDKGAPGLGYTIRYAHETAVVYRKGTPPRPPVPLLSVVRSPIVRGGLHPHQKPTDVMRRLVEWATPAGGTVLDPFCGSGSTGVAAHDAVRNFIGIECDPTHVATARKRLQDAQAQLTLGAA